VNNYPEQNMAITEDIFQNDSNILQDIKKDNDYFSGLVDNNWFKTVCLVFSCLAIIASPLILNSITWFEKYGSDNKRTLLNMVVSLYCWVIIEFVIFVQIPETARFLIGLLPAFVCQLYAFFRVSLVTVMLLYSDTTIITRYIFIFWLKNPAAFCDDFWCQMVSIWVHIFSLIFQAVEHFLSTKMSITYYICIGQEPDVIGQPKLHYFIEVFTILLHIYVNTRIYFFKRSNEASHNFGAIKNSTMKDVEAR
jgi:hypothetical protein